jgi:hypothetical protein
MQQLVNDPPNGMSDEDMIAWMIQNAPSGFFPQPEINVRVMSLILEEKRRSESFIPPALTLSRKIEAGLIAWRSIMTNAVHMLTIMRRLELVMPNVSRETLSAGTRT